MAGSSSRGNKRKRSKRLEKDTTVCLSDLPDAILIHILSFLPTKSLVSTSLLARRWRYLWISTPNLRLDECQFIYDRNKFMNFVERALVLRAGSSLVSFSLSCRLKNDASRINTWITLAIQYNVEQLSLNLLGFEASIFLPFCIFGCRSLVKLDLRISYIRVPSMICLPRLKHLTLKRVVFADNESADKLLSHMLLEELILCNCTWDNVTTVNVNSPKLQSLAIEDEGRKDWSEERQVCFFGDNLKFFRYEGFLPPTQYCICGYTMQLREAVILVKYYDHKVLHMDGPSNRYCKLVNSLSGVQNLTLSSLYFCQCPWLHTTLPVFDRLTRLNLKGCYNPIAITMLYERCPHLEHLNFMDMVSLNFSMEDASILNTIPSCFRTHLKKVTIQGYEPKRYEDEDDYWDYKDPINILFNSALVLEEVVIHWKRDDQVSTIEELERELNARPKVSENCKVSIVLV